MKISLFGASLDTGNLGVSALCYSTIYHLDKHIDGIEWYIFDFGKGIRKEEIQISYHSSSCYNQTTQIEFPIIQPKTRIILPVSIIAGIALAVFSIITLDLYRSVLIEWKKTP